MAQAVWTGAISFGLVSVPVRMLTAVRSHHPPFRQIDKVSGERVRYRRVAEQSQREVPYEDIVKGAEVGDGQYVLLDPAELEAVQPSRSRTIDIEDFVDADEIDPIVWDSTYYLAPDSRHAAAKPYQLLLQAMASTNKVGIARFVLRDKQHLATVRPFGPLLALETMHFADEIRSVDEIDEVPVDAEASEREVRMAEQLIESMVVPWEHDRYVDTYLTRVEELIERKREGEAITVDDDQEEHAEVVDLMEALRSSMRRTREGAAGSDAAAHDDASAHGGGDAASPRWEVMTKEELYAEATRRGLPGRSKMSKDDLVEALRAGRAS